jgi:hypothetical protein
VPLARAVELDLEIAGEKPAFRTVIGSGHRHKTRFKEPARERVVARRQACRSATEWPPVADPAESHRGFCIECGRIGQRQKPSA